MANEELITTMSTLSGKLSELDDVEARLFKAKADFEAYTDHLKDVKKDLAEAKVSLAKAQQENINAHDETIYAKIKELADINARIPPAQEELKGLQAEITSAKQRHEQIEASIESLRRKLA